MKLILFLVAGSILSGSSSFAQGTHQGMSQVSNTLNEFTSDGCSWSPDGTWSESKALVACCVAHDVAYWQGGSRKEREKADFHLKKCVQTRAGNITSLIYYESVKYFGTNMLPTSFRWGYGWANNRPYAPLTRKEKRQVLEKYIKINWLDIYSELYSN